jgi:hypothetical protein
MMLGRQMKGFTAAILLLLLPVLLNACAGMETTQTKVVNEYLLTSAGFGKLDVNNQTPNRQALWDATVKNQFVTYYVGGVKHYVYADNTSHALYIGDEAAYQKFVSKSNDKKLCQSLDATDSSAFWSCYQEFQKGGK